MAKEDTRGMVSKRAYDRKFCFFTDVDYAFLSEISADPIRDISIGGVYIENGNGPDPGERVQMLFSDYSRVDLVTLSGDVVRKEDDGFAVRFLCESTTELNKLKTYINSL